MTTPTSFPILMANIASECGSSCTALESYYAGAGIVPSGKANNNGYSIPSSGAIKYSDFLNFTYFTAVTHIYRTYGVSGYTETVPTGAGNVVIEIIGGSGGGGSGATSQRGGGGGSGGLSRSATIRVSGGQTLKYNVGYFGNAASGQLSSESNVSSGTLTITTQHAGPGVNGGSGSTGGGGAGPGGTANGGSTNTTGNPGTAGGGTGSAPGGAGLVGTYATGNSGGAGAIGAGTQGVNGGNGVVSFAYTA